MFDWFFTPNNTSSKVIAITIGTIKLIAGPPTISCRYTQLCCWVTPYILYTVSGVTKVSAVASCCSSRQRSVPLTPPQTANGRTAAKAVAEVVSASVTGGHSGRAAAYSPVPPVERYAGGR